ADLAHHPRQGCRGPIVHDSRIECIAIDPDRAVLAIHLPRGRPRTSRPHRLDTGEHLDISTIGRTILTVCASRALQALAVEAVTIGLDEIDRRRLTVLRHGLCAPGNGR